MRPVKIIVDSTCDLPPELLKEKEIDIAPLGILFGEESYHDGVDLSVEELYKKVAEKKMLPKTSALSIEELSPLFHQRVNEGYDIFFICISSEFSSCYQHAYLASEDIRDHVVCFDSRNLSSGIGLLILKAIKLKEEGKNIFEIESALKELVPNVRSQFAVETLDYLYKGGRCSSLAFIFGKGFHIRPIIRVKDGKMGVYKKPRGKMVNALNTLLDIFKEDMDHIDLEHVMITHSLGDEYEVYLRNELKKLIPENIILSTRAGCVISSHCGKGTIGILYIVK